jgi:hypothetical protein
MTGKRQPDGTAPPSLEIGEYCRHDGKWCGRAPNGLLVDLARREITEYPDGTITFGSFILVENGEGGTPWRGCLVRGDWREL